MQKMTHGEFRATLLLIGLMAIVVIYAFIFKKSPAPASDIPSQEVEAPAQEIEASTQEIESQAFQGEHLGSDADSLIMLRRAAAIARRDSARKAREAREARESRTATKTAADSTKHRSGKSGKSGKSSRAKKPAANLPSPIDRPV